MHGTNPSVPIYVVEFGFRELNEFFLIFLCVFRYFGLLIIVTYITPSYIVSNI